MMTMVVAYYILFVASIAIVSCANAQGANACNDHFEACEEWESNQGCSKAYMQTHCPKTCNTCNKDTIEMGVPQYLNDQHTEKIKAVVEEAYAYLVKQKEDTASSCRNSFRECAWFAATGHCNGNPTLMNKECGPVCQSCGDKGEIVDKKKEIETKKEEPAKPDKWRRPEYDDGTGPRKDFSDYINEKGEVEIPYTSEDKIDIQPLRTPAKTNKFPCNWSERDNVWSPGFIDRNLLPQNFGNWQPTTGWISTTANPPYVLVFENFISKHETRYLLDYFDRNLGWNVSATCPKTYDTSTCYSRACQENVIIKSILHRIELITGIPYVNAEYAELRRFKDGAVKDTGYDYLPAERTRPQGVRVATFYIFLSDAPKEENYATTWYCPPLENPVVPKVGRAMFWANVKNEAPNEREDRMQYFVRHAASTTQYALNVYLHQRNYKETRDC